MDKYLEIKWQGRAGQGVVTAATLLAEILGNEGKYVQAFPEFIAQKQRPCVRAFNRLSPVPIKTQARVDRAGVVVLMDIRLTAAAGADVKDRTREDAAYIVNTSYPPDFIREKLGLSEENKVYTLDADAVARDIFGSVIPNGRGIPNGRATPGNRVAPGGCAVPGHRVTPNVPLLTVVLESLEFITMERYRERLETLLALKMAPELVEANIAGIQRALDEVVKE